MRRFVQSAEQENGTSIKYTKVDADTGEEVANEDIVKGYKLDTDIRAFK
jgi:DNA end-binding protein Ku